MAGEIVKDLGKVTAYAYAKAAGYTGTEEQFQQVFNEFTQNAPGLLDRLDDAVAGAEAAQTAAETAGTNANAAKNAAEAAQAAAQQTAQDMDDSVQQITTNKNDISVLKESISQLSNDFVKLDAVFIRGGLTNGVINSETNRIVTRDIVSYNYPIFLKLVDNTYKYSVCYYNNDDTVTLNKDFTDTQEYIPSGTKFRIVIAKQTEVAVPADITVFSEKVLMQTTPSFELENVLSIYNKNIFETHIKKLYELKYYLNGVFVYGGYRSISEPVRYPFDVTITNNDGTLYHFNVKTWAADSAVSANYIGSSGWLKTSYTIAKNTWFTLEYARQLSSTPLPTNQQMTSLISYAPSEMIPDIDAQELLTSVDTLNYWNQSAATYSEYLKRYLAHDMFNKYYNNQGVIVPAPTYYAHVAIHSVPVGITVKFDDAEFKVQYFRKDGNTPSDFDGWNSNEKHIPKDTYFMIAAQYPTQITNDEWFEKFTVVADCDIENQNQSCVPAKNYADNYGISNRLQLLWFSDIHADSVRLQRIVDYLGMNSEDISDAICTGDMVSNKVTDDYSFWENAGAGKILTIIGNHDAYTGSGWADTQTVYNKFFAPYISTWDVTYTPNYCNWYKVYNNKVMLIGLTAVNATSADETEMLNFLNTALNAAITNGYAVVIAHHYASNPVYTTDYETNFETIGFNPVDLFIPESVISAVETFKNNSGEFVCYITGHTHADMARFRTTEGQIVLTIGTSALNPGIQSNSQYREPFTKYQDLFNILYVDPNKKIVSIKRIGSDRDVWFRKLDCLSINYATGKIVSY